MLLELIKSSWILKIKVSPAGCLNICDRLKGQCSFPFQERRATIIQRHQVATECCCLPIKMVLIYTFAFTCFQTTWLAGAGHITGAHSVVWYSVIKPPLFLSWKIQHLKLAILLINVVCLLLINICNSIVDYLLVCLHLFRNEGKTWAIFRADCQVTCFVTGCTLSSLGKTQTKTSCFASPSKSAFFEGFEVEN